MKSDRCGGMMIYEKFYYETEQFWGRRCIICGEAYLKNAESEFLASHPDMGRVPKPKGVELSEAIRAALIAKTLPVPSIYDVVWDTFYRLSYRLVLLGEGDGGVQKISVVGSQDKFSEVRTALKNGKEISEATLYLTMQEHQWRITLRALMFHFASFKSPSIKLQKDNITNEADEREAAFYERMYVLEEGLQLFDSFL